jgi:integrase/recombinase XerD
MGQSPYLEVYKRERYRSGQKSFTKNEFQRLMSKVGVLEDEILLTLAVNTGLRRRDITSIEIQNINLKERTTTYYENKKRRWRTIFLSSEMARRLEIYFNTLPKKQKQLFKFNDRTAYNRLNKYCTLAGIPNRPFHALRATCVKFCQAAGWTPEEVAELTGDTIRVIQEHYSTPSLMEMKETTEKKPVW